MKNRLQKIFSHEYPEKYIGQIKFTDSEFSKVFYEKLGEVYETGSSQKIDGVDSIELNQFINGEKYPLDSYEKIIDLHIFPQKEPVEIKVRTEYEDFIWVFDRIKLKEKTILKNNKEDIFYVNFEFLKNSTLNFRVKANPQYASSIIEINKTYSAALELFATIFKDEPIELSEIINSLKNELGFWMRAYKIEQLLNIEFKPDLMELETSNVIMRQIDELYLLLVKKIALRENQGLTSFTINPSLEKEETPIIKDKEKFVLNFSSSQELNILGQEIYIYLVCVAFNHIIDSVKKDDKTGEIIANMREDESSPRYISLKGFASKEEQETEHQMLNENLSENIREYEKAETIDGINKKKLLYK